MPVPNKDLEQRDKKRRHKNIADSSNHKRKSRRRNDPSAAGRPYELPMDLWKQIICSLDVPDLGSCAKVSKEMNAMVMKNDALWEPHLRKLLQKVFDGAFYFFDHNPNPEENWFWASATPKPLLERTLPIPLSKRTPLKSTSFRLWFTEWEKLQTECEKHSPTWRMGRKLHVLVCMSQSSHYEDGLTPFERGHWSVWMNEKFDLEKRDGSWVLEDVPLRTYYKEAATFAYDRFQEYDRDDDIYRGERNGDRVMDIFRGLPDIRIFHGLGGDKNSGCWEFVGIE